MRSLLLLLVALCTSCADAPPEAAPPREVAGLPESSASSDARVVLSEVASPDPSAPDTFDVVIDGVPARVWASSTLPDQGDNSYSAAMAFDGDLSTAWIEGYDDGPVRKTEAEEVDREDYLAAGQQICIAFDQPTMIKSIKVKQGYCKSEKTFAENSYPLVMMVDNKDIYVKDEKRLDYFGYTVGAEYYPSYEKECASDSYNFELELNEMSYLLAIKIEEFISGKRYTDIAVSEITVKLK